MAEQPAKDTELPAPETIKPDTKKPDPKKPDPELHFFGVTEDELPPHLRGLHRAYAVKRKEVAQRMNLPATQQARRASATDLIDQDARRLDQIRSLLPSEEDRTALQKKLREERGLFQLGFGNTLLKDRSTRLKRILKAQGLPNTEENQQAVLDKLIEDVTNKVPYDPENPLFNPEMPGRLDHNATNILNIWSMENLAKQFDTPAELYQNFGTTLKAQEDLENEAAALLKQKLQTGAPKAIYHAMMDGKELTKVPRFNSAFDKSIQESTQHNLLRLLYGDKTSKDLLRMYAEGHATEWTDEELLASMGTETDAKRVKQNAFFSRADALPSDVFIPISGTRDGRFGIAVDQIQDGIENLLFHRERQKLGLEVSEMTEAQKEELRERSRKRTRVLTNSLIDRDQVTVHIDPEGTLRDFLEGTGVRGEALKVASAINTALTLGQKEKIFNNLPDRIARSLIAITLPRRTAGIIADGEELDFAREGDFFVPLLGESKATNMLDYLLRFSVDQPLVHSFAMAVDQEAQERHEDDKGRPMRIVKNMLANVGSEEHIADMTKDHIAGGRFLFEFGDAFINPLLGDFGKEHPTLGTSLGGVLALATMIASPDIFTGVAVGSIGAKASKAKLAQISGLTNQAMIGTGARATGRIIDQATGGKGEVSSADEIAAVDEFINKAARKDKTGAVGAFGLLASAGTLMNHGLAANLRSNSVRRSMDMYVSLKADSRKLLEQAQTARKKAETAKTQTLAEDLELTAIQYEINAVNRAIEAEATVLRTIEGFAIDDTIRKKLGGLVAVAGTSEDAAFLADAFAAFRSYNNAAMAAVAHKYGLIKDAKLFKADSFENQRARSRQLHALVSDKVFSILKHTETKQGRAALKKAMSQKSLKTYDLAKGQTIGALAKIQDLVDRIAKDLQARKGLTAGEAQKAAGDVPRIFVERPRAKSDLLKALGAKYDANLVDLAKVQDRLTSQTAEARKLEERAETLAALSPEELDAFVVNEYNAYLNSMKALAQGAEQVTKLKPKVFNQVMEAVEGRSRAAFNEDIVKGAAETTEPLRKELAKALAGPDTVDDIYSTSALIKVFSDPVGILQLGLRLEDGLPGLFRQPKALIVYATLAIGRVMEKFPIFSTNVRLLESVVRREVDDAAKVSARRTQDLLDSFNIILANVDDLDEANDLIRKILSTTAGVQEVASRYRILGTERATLTLTGVVGRSQSLLRTFLEQAQNMQKARKAAAPSDQLIENPGLSAVIQAFIDESLLTNRAKFYDPGGSYDQLLSKTYTSIAKLDLDLPGDELLAALEGIVRSNIRAIGEEPVTVDVSSLTTAGSMTKFYKGIVLGAMQADFFARVSDIIGPRFNPRMGRAMNFLMGEGAEATDNFAKVDFAVGDYVILRKDAELFNLLTARSRIETKTGDIGKLRLPGRGVVGTQFAPRIDGKGFEARTPKQVLKEFLDDVTPTLEYRADRTQGHSTGFLNPKTMKPHQKGEMMYSTYDVIEWLSRNARGENYRRMARAILPYAPKTNPIYLKKRYNNAHSGPNHMTFDPKFFAPQTIIHESLHNIVTNRVQSYLSRADDLDATAEGRKIRDRALAFQNEMKELISPYIHLGNYTPTERGRALFDAMGYDKKAQAALLPRLAYIFNRGRLAEIHTVPFENPEVQRFLSLIRYESSQRPLQFDHLDFFYDVVPGIREDVKNLLTYVAQHQASQMLGAKMGPLQPKKLGPKVPRPDRTEVVRKMAGYETHQALPAKGRGRQKAFIRLPKLEDLGMQALGTSAYRINKIDQAANVAYLSGGKGEGTFAVALDELVHRDVRLSLLDALDGFSIWGTGSLTNIGRKNVTDELHATRTTYQRMVAASADGHGNVLMVPRSVLNDLNESLTKIQKELDEAISADAASTMLHASGLGLYQKFLRWFKTHILTGLVVPRPAYFMNQLFGDFSQMWLTVGPARAAHLTFMGSLAYVPVYGKSLQNAYFKTVAGMPQGKKGLPLAFSATFNDSLDKILRASDDVLLLKDGTKMTYGQFYAEAIGAGIGENIRIQDFSAAIQKTLRVQSGRLSGVHGALARAGQDLSYLQNIMEMKIREVTRRQRLLMYADARINRGLTEQQATRELANTLYDWTHSVGKHEMASYGRYVLFYTLSKNAMAQVFRMFFEASDVGLKEYMRRYATGSTQLQRFEVMSRLMTQYPVSMTDPYTEVPKEQQDKLAIMREMPKYLEEYPLLSTGQTSPEGIAEMMKGGYVRTHFARTLPKGTSTEYMLNMLDIGAGLSALAVAAGNIMDPEGKVIPLSANPEKALESLVDATIDQFLAPVYSDVFEDFFQELVGISDIPPSEYGPRMRNGDMEFVELLGMMGASDIAVMTQDPNDAGTKRIRYRGGPLASAVANIPKTEYHRFRLMLGLAFPGMAPSEIRALAANDGPTRARLEALGALLNTGKALFYNADSERYWKEDDARDRLKKLENDLERQVNTQIVPTED